MFQLCLLFSEIYFAQIVYLRHFTNPKHIEETGYIIPVFPGIRRVPYGGTVLQCDYVVGLPYIPEAEKERRL